ncbi:hypothetical protein FVE85_7840 [Porphyridium purpureum]|uniref:Uncharacterized protein n=1 Tax=Porphyridium purpureum TaxID=35688 RepID=A0A5J4YI01_PORPP|nr:hypothetical protein FVE85_4599 [Porphyridium purpureum]KAA8490579.1 hypothetical protein FVE85_7840 [Porphyridium purpureum]|eukprot:POR5005..scf271_22
MATVIGTEAANGLKLGGAVAGDVGELIPFAQTIFALTNVLVECALTAKAYGNSCTRLAERVSSISNTLRSCFDTNDENCTTGACDMKDTSLVECMSELESKVQSACALLKRFSGSEKGIEHAIRVLKAKNFQGEFLTCDARLVELELRLARSFVFHLTSEQAQNRGQENRDHQVVIGELEAVLRRLETGPDEMVRALEDDGLSNTKTLENELGSCPERSAVLSMHGLEVKVTESYLKAADSGLDSKVLDQSEPWYVEAAIAEKLTNVNGERIILSPLGAVGFGNVFKGMFMGLEVAIKEIKLAGIKALAELRNEPGIIWRLSHENIVQTRGGFYPRTQMDMHNAECPFCARVRCEGLVGNAHVSRQRKGITIA